MCGDAFLLSLVVLGKVIYDMSFDRPGTANTDRLGHGMVALKHVSENKKGNVYICLPACLSVCRHVFRHVYM